MSSLTFLVHQNKSEVGETFIHSLWLASALMLVIEGIMPFLNPTTFRRALLQMAGMTDQQLRTIGLICMISGVVLLYWVN